MHSGCGFSERAFVAVGVSVLVGIAIGTVVGVTEDDCLEMIVVGVRKSPEASESDSRLPSELWSVQRVAEYLGVPVSTLYQWRYEGRGPEAFRVGRWLRYDPEQVRLWLHDSCRREAG